MVCDGARTQGRIRDGAGAEVEVGRRELQCTCAEMVIEVVRGGQAGHPNPV